jgi:hypothetical protein
VPVAPFAQTLSFGVGTFLAAGMVDLVAHFGPTVWSSGASPPMSCRSTARTWPGR